MAVSALELAATVIDYFFYFFCINSDKNTENM
jgi:hypothetical protein